MYYQGYVTIRVVGEQLFWKKKKRTNEHSPNFTEVWRRIFFPRRHGGPLHRIQREACRHQQRAPTRTLDRLRVCAASPRLSLSTLARSLIMNRYAAADFFACATSCTHAASMLRVLCLHPRVQMLFLTRPSALSQTGTTSELRCGENTDDGTVRSQMEQEMQQARHDILQLSVVSGISDMVNGKRQGFRVNLRCHSASQHGTKEIYSLTRR